MEEKKHNEITDEKLDTVSGGAKVRFEPVELEYDLCNCRTCHHLVKPLRRANGRLECPDCHNVI